MTALSKYVSKGLNPGGFLTAVISNDLRSAVQLANSNNLSALPELIAHLETLPNACVGSPAKMNNWIAKFRTSPEEEMLSTRYIREQVAKDMEVFYNVWKKK